MKRNKTPEPSKNFSHDEIEKLCNEMLEWFHSSDGNIFLDDFLFIHKKYLKSDVEYLLVNFSNFKQAVENANSIELAKLKKFGSADRLNSNIVKSILINKYDWI